MRLVELPVEGIEAVQVPPGPNLSREVGEATVGRVEEVDIGGQPVPLEGEPGLLLQVARGDPDPVADRAETEPRQAGPEQVALPPLGLGTEKTASTQPSANVARRRSKMRRSPSSRICRASDDSA